LYHEIVGSVTPEERDAIQKIHYRRLALYDLIHFLNDRCRETESLDENLYQRIVRDLSRANAEFESWWRAKASEYKWKKIPNGHWSVDFDTCEVILELKEENFGW
jgi:CXXX repeat modification system protein